MKIEMKNRLKYLSLILLGIILISIFGYFCIQLNKLKSVGRIYQEENASLIFEKTDLLIYKKFRDNEMVLNGTTISPESIIYNSEYEIVTMEEQMDRDELILFFSEYHCNMCVDSLINILQTMDFFKESGVTLWVNSSNFKYINWVGKNYNIRSNVIFKTSPGIEEQILDIESPYFFVLEKESKRIYSVFIPLKENSDLTRKYLQDVKNKY